MNFKRHTHPDALERYAFQWSELRLVIAAVALFIGGDKDRLGRPDPAANEAMRTARARVQELAVRFGVAGGHRTYLDQCAGVLRATVASEMMLIVR